MILLRIGKTSHAGKNPMDSRHPLLVLGEKLMVVRSSPKSQIGITWAVPLRLQSLVVATGNNATPSRSLSQVLNLEWFRFQFLWTQYLGLGEKLPDDSD